MKNVFAIAFIAATLVACEDDKDETKGTTSASTASAGGSQGTGGSTATAGGEQGTGGMGQGGSTATAGGQPGTGGAGGN